MHNRLCSLAFLTLLGGVAGCIADDDTPLAIEATPRIADDRALLVSLLTNEGAPADRLSSDIRMFLSSGPPSPSQRQLAQDWATRLAKDEPVWLASVGADLRSGDVLRVRNALSLVRTKVAVLGPDESEASLAPRAPRAGEDIVTEPHVAVFVNAQVVWVIANGPGLMAQTQTPALALDRVAAALSTALQE